MTDRMGYALILGLLVLVHTVAAGAGTGKPMDFSLSVEAGMVTLKANDVPQRRILEGLAKALNFELVVAGPLEERRSLDIDGRPWEEALKKALVPASWALLYDSSAGQARLAKVFVFALKTDGSGPGRPSSGPGRIAAPTPAFRPPAARPDQPLPQPAQQGSDHSIGEALEAEDDETRALALVDLATTGGEQAIMALQQALQDREPWIRETAVEALAEIGGEQAIQGLQLALRDENEDVRKAAQEALTRLQPTPQ
jgi:hypothetical protein